MDEIKQKLKLIIKNLYNLNFEPELTPSPSNIDADYSTNAPLKLTKDLHKSPMQIAGELETGFGTFETVSREGYDPSEVTEPRDGGREGTGSRDLHPSERALIKKLLEYRGVLAESVAEMAPHKVANYLYELAQDFSRFYENCQVTGSSEEKERLKIVKVYLDTMTHGLNILGIEIPEEM